MVQPAKKPMRSGLGSPGGSHCLAEVSAARVCHALALCRGPKLRRRFCRGRSVSGGSQSQLEFGGFPSTQSGGDFDNDKIMGLVPVGDKIAPTRSQVCWFGCTVFRDLDLEMTAPRNGSLQRYAHLACVGLRWEKLIPHCTIYGSGCLLRTIYASEGLFGTPRKRPCAFSAAGLPLHMFWPMDLFRDGRDVQCK